MGDTSGFREVLEADRTATIDRVRSLRVEVEGIVTASAAANGDDEHDPEGATIAYERARATALLTDAVDHLAALDRAEERLSAGTYAVCEQCDGPIGADRLAARPAGVTCVGCACSRPVGSVVIR